MGIAVDGVEQRIRQSLDTIMTSQLFQAWLSSEGALAESDLICINNSFICRERVKTSKSKEYLCVTCDREGRIDRSTAATSTPPPFNVDFKRLHAKRGALPPCRPLPEAITSQLTNLGELVFVLIGAIDDTVPAEVPINHALFQALRFEPAAHDLAEIADPNTIVINSLHDPDAAWIQIEKRAQERGLIQGALPDNLESPLATAFDQLQTSVYSAVALPEGGVTSIENTVLGRIAATLRRQCTDYERSLKACGQSPTFKGESYNNVLRIAYNFASDATRFIELLVSICDLKPVVLWCTMAEHHGLAKALQSLPWTRSNTKALLAKYENTICGARNNSFHNLFPFQRCLEVDLTDVSLRARRLRLFSAHSNKKGNALEYEDQEIVELLKQFTRAPETAVPLAFWKHNLEVMRATQLLFEETANALLLIRNASVEAEWAKGRRLIGDQDITGAREDLINAAKN